MWFVMMLCMDVIACVCVDVCECGVCVRVCVLCLCKCLCDHYSAFARHRGKGRPACSSGLKRGIGPLSPRARRGRWWYHLEGDRGLRRLQNGYHITMYIVRLLYLCVRVPRGGDAHRAGLSWRPRVRSSRRRPSLVFVVRPKVCKALSEGYASFRGARTRALSPSSFLVVACGLPGTSAPWYRGATPPPR